MRHNQPLRSSNQSSSNYHHNMSNQMCQATPQQPSYYSGVMVPMSSQMAHHSRDAQPPHQMLAPTTFMETTPFVAAIPVQPVIATPTFGPTVIQQIPHSSSLDYLHSNVILTPAQNQIQDQLQRKHEELQHLIQQQQDELRRVSEQLMMARYGVIPGVVGVPFSTPNSPVCDNRYIGSLTPSQTQAPSVHHLQPQPIQMMGHPSSQQPPPLPSVSDRVPHMHQFPITHQRSEQSNSSNDHPPNNQPQEYIQLDMSGGNTSNVQQMMATASTSTSGMPGQSTSRSGTGSDVLQFQMNQEQAQSLFNAGQDRSVITSTTTTGQNIHQTN